MNSGDMCQWQYGIIGLYWISVTNGKRRREVNIRDEEKEEEATHKKKTGGGFVCHLK